MFIHVSSHAPPSNALGPLHPQKKKKTASVSNLVRSTKHQLHFPDAPIIANIDHRNRQFSRNSQSRYGCVDVRCSVHDQRKARQVRNPLDPLTVDADRHRRVAGDDLHVAVQVQPDCRAGGN